MTEGRPDGNRSPGSLSKGWFELLILVFPRGTRERFGDSMRETFDFRFREFRARGFFFMWGFLLHNTLDMAVAGMRARFRSGVPHPASAAARTAKYEKRANRYRTQVMENLKQDLIFAIRSLTRNPVFSLAALLTLSLGIGATTSIFSVVNGVLLKPLPYENQDRLVAVYASSVQWPENKGNMSGPDILSLAETRSLETMIGYTGGVATLTEMGAARLIPGARVSDGLLSTFGLRPLMGRDLRREETIPGSPGVVLIGYGFWQEELGGRNDVLGQTLQLQGDSYEIVGVAPQGFDFPDGARLWRPYYRDDESCGRGCHVFDAVGRLAQGTSIDVAKEEATSLAVGLDEEFPDSNFEKRFNLMTLENATVGEIRPQLWILLSAVALVLLVACANVANLLLARAQGRMGEVGIRAALGARRGRLVQQILTESLVLALVGGGVGLGLTFIGVDVLKGMAPESLPRVDEISVDLSVLLFALLLSVGVSLLFGLSPALRLARSSPADALGRSRRGGDAGRAGRRSRSLLLASQVALSLVLLIGAGLLLRTLGRLQQIEPGYRTEGVTRFILSLPESAYPELGQVAGFFESLETRLAGLPGVESVGSAFGAPLGTMNAMGAVAVEGEPDPPPGEEIPALVQPVTPGYLGTMGIPVLRGRGVLPSDREGAPEVALVNQVLADALFPGEDPLGKRIRVTVDFGYGSPYRTIVGVVADSRTLSLTAEPRGAFYVPQRQAGPSFLTVAVRSRPGSGSLIGSIRQEVVAMDPDLPLRAVETMEEVVAEAMAPTRFLLTLLGVFGVLAASLAAVGLYGVATYMVSRRRQEIGIRMALGAQGHRVTRMVVQQAVVPTLVGVVAGLGGALVGATVLERLLFEVNPRDPLVYAGVTVILLSVSVLATIFPARQASKVDPAEALRRE